MTIAPIVKQVVRNRLKQITTPNRLDHLPYNEWLTTLFPSLFTSSFASHHLDFWQHVESISDLRPEVLFFILARGGGKDASAQGATARLGALGKRKFALYVCATQALANKSVQTISSMLEDSTMEQYYPKMASRQVSKYGTSKGWRVDMLRCANGFNVVGLGLDAHVRSLRLDQYRPDLIILSDIDSRTDTPDAVKKKVDTIKFDIVPAGTSNTAIMFIQNLIHENGIMSQAINNKLDLFNNRKVIGPIKALENPVYDLDENGRQVIVDGQPTWEHQSLKACQDLAADVGVLTFRIECQHEVNLNEGGMYHNAGIKFQHVTEVPELISVVCACDPAVTETGDKQAIQIDGLGVDDVIYRLYSWEENASPQEAVVEAIVKAVEFRADVLLFETDQGGDLWQESFNANWEQLIEDGLLDSEAVQPDFVSSRAGSIGSKKHRGQLQLAEYSKGRFRHVIGTHQALEDALNRFPLRKPFDLHDAAFWSMWELTENTPAGN